jgi:Prealbumin-like fold domain
MKKAFVIIALLICSAQVFAQQNPPVKGVGVVVKRNPNGTGSHIVLNPTPEGRTNFSLSEAGNYTVNVQSLSSVSLQGGSVKGVKVGLSKNPPNAIIATGVSDDNGDVEFKNLAPGDYAIEVTESGKPDKLLPITDISAKTKGINKKPPTKALDESGKQPKSKNAELIRN